MLATWPPHGLWNLLLAYGAHVVVIHFVKHRRRRLLILCVAVAIVVTDAKTPLLRVQRALLPRTLIPCTLLQLLLMLHVPQTHLESIFDLLLFACSELQSTNLLLRTLRP
jgi:hypothetical protein